MNPETRRGLSVALGQLVTVLDTTIAVVAIPALMRHFAASLAQVQWVTVGYVLALVASMPVSAWVAARCGARRTYVVSLVIFAVASLGAGLAPDLRTLVAARVLMGLAGGLVGPVGMMLALDGVPPDRRGRMGALLGLPVLVGPLLGPITAAWLVDSVSWRAIFWVTIPPALAAAALVQRFAPARTEAAASALDLRGLLLLVPGVVALVYGVGESVWLLAAAGALLIVTFGRYAWNQPAPLLSVRLLSHPTYRRSFTVAALFAAAYFGSMLLSPTYVQVIRGDSAWVSGLVAVPAGLATGVSLQICTRLIDHVPAHRIITAGLLVTAVAVVGFVVLVRPHTSYLLWAVLAALLGLGSGAVLMPSMTTATRELTGSDLGSGTAMLTVANQIANALGNAATVAAFSALAATGITAQVAALRWAYLVPLAMIAMAIPVAWRLRAGTETHTVVTARQEVRA